MKISSRWFFSIGFFLLSFAITVPPAVTAQVRSVEKATPLDQPRLSDDDFQFLSDDELLAKAGMPESKSAVKAKLTLTVSDWDAGSYDEARLITAIAMHRGLIPESVPKDAQMHAESLMRVDFQSQRAKVLNARARLLLSEMPLDAETKELRLMQAARDGNPIAELQYGKALIAKGKMTEGVEFQKRAADAGYNIAQWQLGRAQVSGEIPGEFQQGIENLHRAADRGLVEAQLELADLTIKSGPAASGWDLTAADLGTLRDAALLGKSRFLERANPIEAASAKDATASTLMGIALRSGIRIKQDPQGALKHFVNAAIRGEAHAMTVLGESYMCVSRDLANSWFQRAAKLGNLRGEFLLRDWAGKPDARAFLEKAAQAGLADAQIELAEAMYTGQFGVKKDKSKAREWFTKAAAQHDPDDLLRIARDYEDGKNAQRDEKIALQFYAQAALAGSQEGSARIAASFESGKGVRRDLLKAALWYEKAGDPVSLYRAAFIYDVAPKSRRNSVKASALYARALDGRVDEAGYRLGMLVKEVGKAGIAPGIDPDYHVHWKRAAQLENVSAALQLALEADAALKAANRKIEDLGIDEQMSLLRNYIIASGAEDPWVLYRTGMLMENQAYVALWIDWRAYCSTHEQIKCDVGPKDFVVAAAAKGLPEAQTWVGRSYLYGFNRLPEDHAIAEQLLAPAAQHGNVRGQYYYSIALYLRGDRKNGELWMRKAAAQGHKKAISIVADLNAARAQVEAEQAAERKRNKGRGFWATLNEVLQGINEGFEQQRREQQAAWSLYSNVGSWSADGNSSGSSNSGGSDSGSGDSSSGGYSSGSDSGDSSAGGDSSSYSSAGSGGSGGSTGGNSSSNAGNSSGGGSGAGSSGYLVIEQIKRPAEPVRATLPVAKPTPPASVSTKPAKSCWCRPCSAPCQ